MSKPINIDQLEKPYFVWYEDHWVHDDILHQHNKAQLVYVQSGFQYLTIENRVFLLPQNHAAWIPPNTLHKTNTHSDKIKLMVIFFDVESTLPFYQHADVFSVPPVLKEMIQYAEKWSKQLTRNADEEVFLKAMLNELPNFVAQALHLHMPLPSDPRLQAVLLHIHQHYSESLKIEDLVKYIPLSQRSLERIFKKETGLTLNKYLQMVRIIKSIELLSSNEFSISEIAYLVGYRSLQAFTNSFLSVMQMRPTDFAKTTVL